MEGVWSKMGFSYLNGYSWSEVSREERFFCSILYECIRGKEREFIGWLNKKDSQSSENKLQFSEEEIASEWEVAFEACFYRDIFSLNNLPGISYSEYSQKRTFDICLFSENRIVIIEAKAQQGFSPKEVKTFIKDKGDIPELLKQTLSKHTIKVDLVGLASSKYIGNLRKKNTDSILSNFDSIITWDELSKYFDNNQLLLRADQKY